MKLIFLILFAAAAITPAFGHEYHVALNGADNNSGTQAVPFRTIQHAADVAQPGDVITVHAGIYREQVSPPRGGESDAKRITYQAAPGEKVTITGSEPVKDWQKVSGDVWKVVIPSHYFGAFNPYSDLIHGDWYVSGRPNHTGAVYLNGAWLVEGSSLDQVMDRPGGLAYWFATVDGVETSEALIVNVASLKLGEGATIPAAKSSAKRGTQVAPCSEGGQCVGFIKPGDWLRYDNVDCGAGISKITLRVASLNEASRIEIHLGSPAGRLLGFVQAPPTGDWQKWTNVTAAIQPISGKQSICVLFHTSHFDTSTSDNTTIWADFKGGDPNQSDVEINVRKTVFSPEKTGINYITVRGFTMRNAATNWAPPSAGQIGMVTAYWCKGWIIENNDIAYSRCCGIALGKYSDEFDNTNNAGTADPYTECVHRALDHGWNKETVGSHIVRNNRVSFCGQTGIVGSMGCAFSTISGNEIHDIHVGQSFQGWEMAGIKFHGAIDVTISDNHIYRVGANGLWLDWMGQGAQVTGNLMHNNGGDIFFEMQHGPILVANNLLFSPASVYLNSQGIAIAHNLLAAGLGGVRGDPRSTPVQEPHSTAIAKMYNSRDGDSGDDRLYNNVLAPGVTLHFFDGLALPCFSGGNISLKAPVQLTEKSDGWYLAIQGEPWAAEAEKCQQVTTGLLGVAKIPNEAFENADGSPIKLDTDYFGNRRDMTNPSPGPFELPKGGAQSIKVWPKGTTD